MFTTPLLTRTEFVNRDYSRPIDDEWKLRVQDRLRDGKESVEVHGPNGEVVGWKIQSRYE